MAINPNISLAVKGIELQDPMAQYSKLTAIQNAQKQNQLAQMQMRQTERDLEATNAMNRAYSEAYDTKTGDIDFNRLRESLATGGYGSKLPDLEKKYYEGVKPKLKR